jgi:hypothetical protein
VSIGLLAYLQGACSTVVSTAGRGQLKCDGTRAGTRFRISAKRTSPFKSAGALVQSTTGSRGVRISDSNAGSVKSTGYPLHSPVPLHFSSRASPCAITFQLDSKIAGSENKITKFQFRTNSDFFYTLYNHQHCNDTSAPRHRAINPQNSVAEVIFLC